jgi:S1-C subfamily serine protease
VTNAHVVQGCVGDILGNPSGEAPAKLRLVSSDETNDLALLQATGSFKEVAKIRDKAIQSGDSVVAIGYPFHGLLTSDFTVTTGIVSSLSGILNDTRFLQISAAIQPGNSGGPAIGLERRRGRRCRGETECHQVREGNGQHSREHQFRHQDRGAEGFSR